MSRLKGCVAAGLHTLSKRPALLTEYGRVACVFAGCAVLLIGQSSLTGVIGSQGVPVPPRKPDTLSLAVVAPAMSSNADMEVGPYRSPFAGEQMDIYRNIFFLQAQGRMKEADDLIGRIKDKSLMGHVLAQRYLHPEYKAAFEELKTWMSLYADHPEAQRIERLAGIRMPNGHQGSLTKASYNASRIEELGRDSVAAKTYAPKVKRSPAQNDEATAMIKTIRKQVQIYEPTKAMATLRDTKASLYLDSVEKDRLKALIASGYLYAGNMEKAKELSGDALRGSKTNAPMAGWVQGLVLWREGEFAKAAPAFESTAESPYSTGHMASAASFWAARAHQKAGHARKSRAFLEKAAEYPRTFYGLLAIQTLGKKAALNWDAPQLSRSEEKAILATPAGHRAEKLIAAGQVSLAEAEINALYVSGDHKRKKELLAYAAERRLPSLTLKLAHSVPDETYDAGLYPAMPWEPRAGYRIDRALIHAIIRQESRFNPSAENKGSGAAGLMQLMPTTASYMAKDNAFKDRANVHLLKDPMTSLDIGQKYVEYLLNNPLVGQDLLSLAIAYNAGPGNLQKWKNERQDISDPLLFIETIPFAETRHFVERVMSNYWIYRMRFDQNNDSMQALAEGNWARYASLDKGAVKFAAK